MWLRTEPLGSPVDTGGQGSFSLPDAEVDAPSLLDLSIEASPAVLCPGDCATLSVSASGGQPPYTYEWDHGLSANEGPVLVCPRQTTTYHVTAVDSSGAGELEAPDATGSASVTIPVDGTCSSSGVDASADANPTGDIDASDSATPSCDRVTDVSPAGANPFGPWAYGWSNALGSTFMAYDEFFPSVEIMAYTVAPPGEGPCIWSSGPIGSQLNPGAYFNETGAVYTLASTTAQPGQFWLHPGPSGQYSIVRWTASAAGIYNLQASFEGIVTGSPPTTTDVHVERNGTSLASGNLNLYGFGNSLSVTQVLSLAAGDALDFAVGYGNGSYVYDSTALSAVICLEVASH